MSDDYLVRHCAPTLAGLKTGSLFTCPFSCRKKLLNSVRKMNERLGSKGVRILPLRFTDEKALIYVYRPGKLSSDLSDSKAAAILQQQGYCTGSCEKCIGQLAENFAGKKNSPTKLAFFWAIRRRMSAALWKTKPATVNVWAAGRFTETKRQQKRNLPNTKNAHRSTVTGGQMEPILNG